MEAALIQQKVHQELLIKCIKNAKKESTERRTKAFYTRKLVQFEGLWNNFEKQHKDILILQHSDKTFDPEKCPYFTEQVYDTAEEHFLTNVAILEEYIEKLSPSVQPPPPTSSVTPATNRADTAPTISVNSNEGRNFTSIKLPKLVIDKFKGDYKTWTTFYDLFNTMVHQNQAYAPVQKLQYLKLLLEGEPENLIKHLHITDDNYEPAWALLKERYDNKRVLVNSQLELFFNQPVVVTETAQGIKQLLDTTTECLLSMHNLKVEVSNWDPLIVHLIVKRLPASTHQLWEQSISENSDLPTWADLQEFLKTRFRTLEAISLKRTNYNKTPPKPVTQRSHIRTFHIATQSACPVCSQAHSIRNCPQFLALPTQRKVESVKTNRLCFNCLGYGHSSSTCLSKRKCRQCNRRHHSSLHINRTSEERRPQASDIRGQTDATNNARPSANTTMINPSVESDLKYPQGMSNVITANLGSYAVNKAQNNYVLLATALVRVVSPSGREQVVRALIDQGSQASFITETISQDLQLNKEPINVTIHGVGMEDLDCARYKTNFVIKSLKRNNTSVDVIGLVLRKVSEVSSMPTARRQQWTHLKNIELADPHYHQPGKIDLLLGADVYGKILMEGLIKGPAGSPIAQKTTMGWILSGEIESQNGESLSLQTFHISADPDHQLKRFWELEELPEKPLHTDEEIECETRFKHTTKRLEDGRYEVQLPIKPQTAEIHLGRSKNIAISRLLQMERRFAKDPKLYQNYINCFDEYLELKHMTKVTTAEEDHQQSLNGIEVYSCSYLPHHGVFKDTSTTTKLRVVFDASRSTDSGVSLNDMMLKGPVLQDELTALLIRWRKHRIAFTADLEKMYRQIRVRAADAEYQRVVWRVSPNHPIEEYKLLTVTFGTKSAPYLATRVLKQLALDEEKRYPKASDVTLSDFYVDDLLSGAPTINEALVVLQQMLQLMKAGGFSLRKWSSNCKELLEALPPQYCETNLPFEISYDDNIRALGTFWKPASDSLVYTYTQQPEPHKWTKRTILSETCKLFDPLGLLAPIIIKAKLMIQTLWLQGLDWDEEIPHQLQNEWLKYKTDLSDIKNITTKRWTGYTNAESKVELHGFSDASMKAYAAAVYLCVVDDRGDRFATLMAAKTKVAPLKTVTLPRLELCAAVLLAKLLRYVITALKLDVSYSVHAWTDSEIVIAWIRGHPTRWKTFVANRVSHIHEVLGENAWNHVPSKQNPADCASRGMSPTELSGYALWWHGPEWLRKPKDQWPKIQHHPHTELEERKITNLQVNIDSDNFDQNYSSLTKLLRVTAYIKRFVYNAQRPATQRRSKYLKVDELDLALQYWLKQVQARHFSNDIKAIRQQRSLPRQSRLSKLSPFIDDHGILRVGGRLRHSDLPFRERFPVILPDKCHLSSLIINKAHRDTLHGGPQLMMRVLAQSYWLLNARNTIRHQIHKCMTCFRQKAATQSQLMGDLPAPRIQLSHPFSHTGVDYCGPFELRTHKGRNPKKYKAYISLFVCMATKALHLEVVTDLTAEGFVAAFRRFTARRGLCSELYCDCGTNFVGANRILRSQQQALDLLTDDLGAILENEGVKFNFIPPSSPHFGGLWEAGVKSTKYHIKRVIGTAMLTYEEFTTALTQIEACLNSRPLTEMTSDPRDSTPLTPAHFLIGGSLLAMPEPSLLETQINRLNRWQLVQRLVQNFWKRWKGEYLSRLQQRPKWLTTHANIQSGELIILKEDNLPPCHWALGRVLEVHPGKDGLVRVVSILVRNKILKRPITKICKLPFQMNDDQKIENNLKETSLQDSTNANKPYPHIPENPRCSTKKSLSPISHPESESERYNSSHPPL